MIIIEIHGSMGLKRLVEQVCCCVVFYYYLGVIGESALEYAGGSRAGKFLMFFEFFFERFFVYFDALFFCHLLG